MQLEGTLVIILELLALLTDLVLDLDLHFEEGVLLGFVLISDLKGYLLDLADAQHGTVEGTQSHLSLWNGC